MAQMSLKNNQYLVKAQQSDKTTDKTPFCLDQHIADLLLPPPQLGLGICSSFSLSFHLSIHQKIYSSM